MDHRARRKMNTFERSMSTTSNRFVALSYSTYRTKLIRHPYQTDCFDYSKWNLQSKHHCYDDCVLKEVHLTGLNRRPFNVLLRNLTLHQLHWASQKEKFHQFENIDELCANKCKKANCMVVHHVPHIVRSQPLPNIAFELFVSSDPEIVSESKPEISFIDFATFTLSCIGFWLGFSPLVFFSDLKFSEDSETTVNAIEAPNSLENLLQIEFARRDARFAQVMSRLDRIEKRFMIR